MSARPKGIGVPMCDGGVEGSDGAGVGGREESEVPERRGRAGRGRYWGASMCLGPALGVCVQFAWGGAARGKSVGPGP